MVEASMMKRADALGASERATAVEARGPATIVERFPTFDIGQEVRGLYKRSGGSVGISQRCEDPSFDGIWRVLLRASEDR
jgi:hypothetical protein